MKINDAHLVRDSSASGAAQQYSPLVRYALNGLQRCWLPRDGRWSHIHHLDGRTPPNESFAPSDVFYTLNVLLGMSRLSHPPSGVDPAEIFARNVRLTLSVPVPLYAFGMALWSAAQLGLPMPPDISARVSGLLSNEGNWRRFRAQDLGMLLAGIVAQRRVGEDQWRPFAVPLFKFLKDRYHSPSGLFFDTSEGVRRRFASFATQTYLSIACYDYGECMGDASAIRMAGTCAAKIIALQGPQGEWPWFFDARSGRIVDFYEVYSVHQYGMAPALLECAERHDVRGARQALINGFSWVLGSNQLNRSMLVPELSLTIRSQVRKGELQSKTRRAVRALFNTYLGRSAGLTEESRLDLRLECRSYELGWILWSFGQRSDLNQLTHHDAFLAKPRSS